MSELYLSSRRANRIDRIYRVLRFLSTGGVSFLTEPVSIEELPRDKQIKRTKQLAKRIVDSQMQLDAVPRDVLVETANQLATEMNMQGEAQNWGKIPGTNLVKMFELEEPSAPWMLEYLTGQMSDVERSKVNDLGSQP